MITNALFYNKIRISLVFFLLRMATNCLFWNLTLFYFWRNITKKSFVLMIIDQHCIMAADFCDTSLFENETPILIILKRFFMAFPWQKLAYKWNYRCHHHHHHQHILQLIFFSRNKLDPFQLFQFHLLIFLNWFFSMRFFFTFPFAIKTFQLFKALLRSDSNDDCDMCLDRIY